jgi:hypothetical protein
MKPVRLEPTLENLALAVDLFCASIETKTLPSINSPCHHMVRWLVDDNGTKTSRKKTRLKHRKPKVDWMDEVTEIEL